MKRQEEFVWGSDDDRGTSGWILASMPHFDPVQGMALAHDFLEHTDTYAGMEGEAMAFGGICYIRVDGGYFDEDRSSRGQRPNHAEYATTLGEELAGFFRYDDGDSWKIERTEEPPLEDEEMDQFICDIARQCCREGLARFVEADDDWERRRDIRVASLGLINWMRRGYRKCETFWDAGNSQAMTALFQDIESTIDTDIKYCDFQPGDRISVHVNDDLTWGYQIIDGMDSNGEFWENGEISNPSDGDDEWT